MDSLMNPHGGGRRVRGRALTVGTATVGLVALMLVGTAGTVLGHAVTAVSGTVDCAGNYTISVTGDVYGQVHLFVNVGTTLIDEGAQNGTTDPQTWTFTGTGGSAGEAITAYPGDNRDAGATSTLVAQPSDCNATLKLVKQLSENAPSGDHASDWTLSATATGASTPTLTGRTPVTGQVAPGMYNLSESGGPSDSGNYTASAWSCVSHSSGGDGASNVVSSNSLTLAAGDNVICTITNTYSPPLNLTVEKLICPNYGVVPANSNYTSQADYPSGKTLDTNYQTSVTDPATDTPEGCTLASGWTFDVGTGADGGQDYIGTVTHTLTTDTSGTATLTLSPTEVATIQDATSWDQGLLVREVMQSSSTFGELDCYRDIENGDNLESLYNKDGLFTSDLENADGVLNIYCIAYNVAPPTISTSLSGGETESGQTIAVLNGTSVTDTATLYDANQHVATDATGNIDFGLYTDSACTTAATTGFTPSAGPSAGTLTDGVATSGSVTFQDDGTYYWKASYAGDSHYLPASSCNEYVVVQSEQPTTSTLVVVKNTIGGDGTFSFSGTGTGVDSSFNLTTSSGTAQTSFTDLTPGSGYAVSESSASGWTQTSVTCTGENSPSDITIVAGQTVTCTFTNTKYSPPPPPVTPLTPKIAIVKVANPTHLGVGGGSVTYTYTVTNPGQTTLSTVTVTDDRCAPVTYVSGDANHDSQLETTEAWTYTCTTTLTQTTTNTATATGYYNGLPVTATAQAVVTVAPPTPTPTPTATPGGGVLGATGTPSLPPTTEIPGQGGGPNGTILLLLGALGAASLALIATTLLRERLLEYVDRR